MKNNLRTNEVANNVKSILDNATLYKEAVQGSVNTNIDLTNKVATLFGATPINRCEIWIDSNAIVLFVGANIKAMFDESVNLLMSADELSDEMKDKIKSFVDSFNNSRYFKYKISEKIETKHKFLSVDDFKSFIDNSNEVITSAIELSKQLKAEAEAEAQKAEATTTAEAKQKQKRNSSKQKQNSRSKAKQQNG